MPCTAFSVGSTDRRSADDPAAAGVRGRATLLTLTATIAVNVSRVPAGSTELEAPDVLAVARDDVDLVCRHGVAAAAAADHVLLPVAGADAVVAGTAVDRVLAVAARELVVAVGAAQTIVAGTTVQGVGSAAAHDAVVVDPTAERVVAGSAVHDVEPRASRHRVAAT